MKNTEIVISEKNI